MLKEVNDQFIDESKELYLVFMDLKILYVRLDGDTEVQMRLFFIDTLM